MGVAKEQGVDLLVMGHHKPHPHALSETLLGGIVRYVAHHAPCRVIVQIPAPEKIVRREKILNFVGMKPHQGAAQAAAIVVANLDQFKSQLLRPGFPHQNAGVDGMHSRLKLQGDRAAGFDVALALSHAAAQAELVEKP